MKRNQQLRNQLQNELRSLPSLAPQCEQVEPQAGSEPFGHVHPNYRHWTWFRPSNW